MNIKKNRKQGVCIAMRCKEPSWEGSDFCERHNSTRNLPPPPNENVLGGALKDPEAVEVEAALETETTEATEAYALAESFEITTQDELVFAAEIIADAKGSYNRLEEQRSQILKPLNESVKRIRELFRPAMEYYSAIEATIKTKVADAARAQAANNARALAEAQAQTDAGLEPTAIAEVQHIGNVSGLQVREVWDFEVTDEEKVDRALMSVDLMKVRGFMKECNAAEEAPVAEGIRFFKKSVVASRAS